MPLEVLTLAKKILEEHTNPSTGSAEIILLGFADNHVQSEHLGRYLFASTHVKGVVLDVASGSCYGASILGRRGYIVAVDIQGDLLSYGRTVYDLGLHDVVQADARCPPFRECGFDAVVSLEALEHLSDPRRFVAQANRCLKKNGSLLLSTPNKMYSSPFCPSTLNPYHLKEFYCGELTDLLKEFFVLVETYGQERISFTVLVRRTVGSLLKYLLRKTNFCISTLDNTYRRACNGLQTGNSIGEAVDPYPLLDRIERARASSNLFPFKHIIAVLKKHA